MGNKRKPKARVELSGRDWLETMTERQSYSNPFICDIAEAAIKEWDAGNVDYAVWLAMMAVVETFAPIWGKFQKINVTNRVKAKRMLAAKMKNGSDSRRGRIIPLEEKLDAVRLYCEHKAAGRKDPAGKAAKAFGMSRSSLLGFAKNQPAD
jgi:hypothetical protein